MSTFVVCKTFKIRKIMKKSIIILATLITFFACESHKKHDISESARTNLQDKDTVCFGSNQGSNIDTFVIAKYNIYFVDTKSDFWEKIVLKYANINRQSELKGFEVYLDAVRMFAITDYVTSNNFKRFDIEVNNEMYSVFAVKYTYPEANAQPDSIYYSHKEGILRYFYPDAIYNRINVMPWKK